MATAVEVRPVDMTSFSTKRKRGGAIISDAIDKMICAKPGRVFFDKDKHLNFKQPSKVHSMRDIGLEDVGISPVAVSEPFPLFTEDAVSQIRKEVLSEDVWANYHYTSNIAQCQLRGFCPEYAPFVYDVWKSPEVLEIVSKIAGVELVPAMDFEIGHVNISVQSEKQKKEALAALVERENREADEGVAGCPWEDDGRPIVDWHTDSYPFVCVTMLSDCTDMIGGETALRTGTGDVLKVRGPGMGHAVVLQGRYIEHQALRALGTTERITMVTSFRAKSAWMPDDTVLTTVRSISDLGELYSQFGEYRLEMLEQRIRDCLKNIRDQKRAKRGFNTAEFKQFLQEQEAFLSKMNKEIVEDSLVQKGFTDDSHLISDDLKKAAKKRRTLQ